MVLGHRKGFEFLELSFVLLPFDFSWSYGKARQLSLVCPDAKRLKRALYRQNRRPERLEHFYPSTLEAEVHSQRGYGLGAQPRAVAIDLSVFYRAHELSRWLIAWLT